MVARKEAPKPPDEEWNWELLVQQLAQFDIFQSSFDAAVMDRHILTSDGDIVICVLSLLPYQSLRKRGVIEVPVYSKVLKSIFVCI